MLKAIPIAHEGAIFYGGVMPACLLAGIYVFICLIYVTAWMPAKRHAGLTQEKPQLHWRAVY